ncbi:MAG TPA: serine hydrolase domain-containing protein [Actinomycetota bacterium]|nr:serine hydrolase domain-containing protein [Actinomycetota bacterium]
MNDSAAKELVDAVLSAGAVGVVAGCSAFDESSIATRSRLDDEDLVEKVFEAGSVTKTFVAMLLVQLVSEGVVSLDDKLSNYFPESPPGISEVSLLELATHTSGLPRLPPNLRASSFDRANPYVRFDEEQLRDALQQTKVGEKTFEYSNYGYCLLGVVASMAARTPLDVALRERVLIPLGLSESRLAIGTMGGDKEAIGHDASDQETPHWDFTPATAGCGAMRMTIGDLLKYVRHMAEGDDGRIQALIRSRVEREKGVDVGLAWMLVCDAVWHTGGTGGFGAFAGFNRKQKRAVALLANSSHGVWRSADPVLLRWLAKDESRS